MKGMVSFTFNGKNLYYKNDIIKNNMVVINNDIRII